MSWPLRERSKNRLAEEISQVEVTPKRFSVALCYPNTYFLGMSNLGYQTVYRRLNEHPEFSCERVFLPDPEEIPLLSRGPGLLSLERQRPVGDFDILAFSLSFEYDYVHILRLLEFAGIPFRSKDRDERHPFLLGGGVCSVANPEAVAPFFDAFLRGDSEVLLTPFFDLYAAYHQKASEGRRHRPGVIFLHGEPVEKASREEFLMEVQKIPGAYVPALFTPRYGSDGRMEGVDPAPGVEALLTTERAKHLSVFCTESSVWTPNTEFSNVHLVEIQRGCPWKCQFCITGHKLMPYRVRRFEGALKESIDRAPESVGTVGFIGSAIGEHPDIKVMLRHALDLGKRFSLASINLKTFDEEFLDLLEEARTRTITIAPEAGSERLRGFLQKNFTNDDIEHLAHMVAPRSFQKVKFYFILGLPSETQEDLQALIDLVKNLKRILLAGRGTKRPFQFVLSVNTFIPKAFTPFAGYPMNDFQTVQKKFTFVKQGLRSEREIRINHDVPQWAHVEGLLSIGDRRVADFLELSHSLKGNVRKAWQQWEGKAESYTLRDRRNDLMLPWGHLK